MRLKKVLTISGLAVLGFLGLVTAFLFNTDKFYSEYWLQSAIDNSGHSPAIMKKGRSTPLISYKFYHDTSIDIAIELDSTGDLRITRRGWFKDTKNEVIYAYSVDKNHFTRLKTEFDSHWTQSKSSDVDYHLGGTYYEIQMVKSDLSTVSIGYYNVTPDDAFLDLKDKLITLATTEIGNSR